MRSMRRPRTSRLAAVCLAAVPFGGLVLGFFGDGFRDGQTALLIVCVAMATRAVFGPGTAILAMKGHHVSSIWILAAGTALSATIGLALFPTMGIEGIAIAYTISNSAVALVQWWWIRHKTGIDHATGYIFL